MFRDKPARIKYCLQLQILDEERNGSRFARRNISKTFEHSLSKQSFEAVFKRDYFKKITDLEHVDEGRFKAELALFEEKFKAFFEEAAERVDNMNVFYDVAEFVQASSVLNENDKMPLYRFLLNYKKTLLAFERFNNSDAANDDEETIAKALNVLKADLKKIWGDEVSFRNDSAEKMAQDFTNFDEILEDIEGDDTPISAKATVKYNFEIKDISGLPKQGTALTRLLNPSRGRDVLAGEVEYWQLPSRLHEIREYIGLAASDVPAFRLTLETRTPDLKAAFRINAQGNSLDELKSKIDEKISERDISAEYPQGLTYAFTLTHLAPNQEPLLLQTPAFASVAELHDDIRDTLLTLEMSGYQNKIPKLSR